jgi:hypothetical protein
MVAILADPLIGLLITLVFRIVGIGQNDFCQLLDGIEPEVPDRAHRRDGRG